MLKKRTFQVLSSNKSTSIEQTSDFKIYRVEKEEFVVPRESLVKQHLIHLAKMLSANSTSPFMIRKIFKTDEEEIFFQDLENFDPALSSIENQIDSMIRFGLETSVRGQIYEKDLFYTDGLLPYTHTNRPELRTFNFAIMSFSQVKGTIVVSCNLEKKKTWIDSLIIDRTCKRQGYGRILVYAASIIAALHGHDEIFLDSSIEGKAFYHKLGFIPKPSDPKGSILKFVISNIDNCLSFGEQIAFLPTKLDIIYLLNSYKKQIEDLSQIKHECSEGMASTELHNDMVTYYNHQVKQKPNVDPLESYSPANSNKRIKLN